MTNPSAYALGVLKRVVREGPAGGSIKLLDLEHVTFLVDRAIGDHLGRSH